MVKQPINSNLCGHCCLSAILNTSLQDVIEKIGHKRGTRPSELYQFFSHKEKRMISLRSPEIPKGYNLVKLRVFDIKKKKEFYHWSVFYSKSEKPSLVYEPNLGYVCEYADLCENYRGEYEFTLVQYITIQERINSNFLA